MNTLRCHCGARTMWTMWTSMGVQPCQGCPDCQTTFASAPDRHKALVPHTPKAQYNRNTGEFSYYICSVCFERWRLRGDARMITLKDETGRGTRVVWLDHRPADPAGEWVHCDRCGGWYRDIPELPSHDLLQPCHQCLLRVKQ